MIAMSRALLAMADDRRTERIREISQYDRDVWFRHAGEDWGVHLYGRQLDTLLAQRQHWRDDIDYTLMVMIAIRQRLWDAFSHDYYICDRRTMEAAYYGECRTWAEQRAARLAAE